MKTKLPRQELVDALTAASAVAGGRTTKPILGCVKLTTEGENIEVAATDGEASLRLGVRAFSVEQRGEVCIPADRLLNLVREMPDAEIHLEADAKACTVRGIGSKFRIFSFPAADFPAIPEFGAEADIVLDGAQIHRMVAMTIYAAARETGRYAINGVLWQKQGKRLFLVATDGRRLARAGGSVAESSAGDFEAIVPVKALKAFERVFAPPRSGNWTVDVRVTPNQILLRSGDRLLATALVEGHFPKYQDVIPTDSDKLAQVSRLDFAGAIRRAALLTSDEARAVKLAFDREQVVITANSPEQGEARVEVPIRFEGEPLEIGFNAGFLIEVLNVIQFDTIIVELKAGFRPGIIRGEDKGEFLYVIMPVSL